MTEKEAAARRDHMTAALIYVFSFLLQTPELTTVDIFHLNGVKKKTGLDQHHFLAYLVWANKLLFIILFNKTCFPFDLYRQL